MVPGIVLAAPHKGPSNVDRRFPLDKAHHLRHRVLRRNGKEHVHVIRHQVPLFNPTFLLRGQRPEDLPEMPPQLMVERFPTILRDKHHMILAVPRGMIQSLDVWHDRLPLRETLSGSREGVCRFDSRSCQTLGVPRQSRGFTLGNQRIDHYHQHLWDTCSDEQDVIYVLAILAVRDEFTTREELRDLLHMLRVDATMFSVEKAIEKVRHILRVSDARSIAIRHNSLREFIAERTQPLQQEINGVLATWYAQNPDRDEAWRHRFRHLFQLGEYSTLLDACDDEWLTRSWTHHRPMHETQRNLNIAWRAASVQKDVIEYIRIALLKQRVALVDRNLELSDAKIGHLFLDMGRPEEALRRVWDGESPQCGSVEFAEFVLHHAQCIGRVPPQHILEAGLSELPASASPQELKTWYRACAYARDPLKLISEIDGIRWRAEGAHRHLRGRVEEDENRALNLGLQLAVVQELAGRKAFNDLQSLYASNAVPEVVRTASRAASALVLARVGEAQGATTELTKLELSSMPAEVRHWLVLGLAECGIEVSPGLIESGYPELPTQLCKPMKPELEGQLFSLYDRLRVFFLRDDTGYPWLEARTSSLSEPVKTLVRALGLLAHLWCSCIRARGNIASCLAQLKEVAIALDMDRQLFARLDYRADFAKDLYREAAHRFYDALWSCAVEYLSDNDLEALARWWVQSDHGKRASAYAKATRKLAMASHPRLGGARNVILRELLELSERQARTDEETSVIVAEIFECAAAWGRCGFTAEAERLWSELLDLGCGIYWRKDYQFNEIVIPLKFADAQDPSSTLTRLEEQLVLAHQLIGTARGRTIAAAIEGLIAFTARISPGLALSMLEREERWIYRASALHGLILELLQVQGIELRWVQALVATMGRWEDYREYNDHTKPAMFAVYSSALHRHDYEVARRAYDMARYVFFVEKECPSDLGQWAAAWVEAGNAPPDVLRDRDEYGIKQEPDVEPLRNDPSTDEPGWPEDLDSLASQDLAALEERLDELSNESLIHGRRRELDRAYTDWRTIIGQAVGRVLSEDDGEVLNACFAGLMAEICTAPAGSAPATRDAIRAALRRFVEHTAERLDATLTVEAFEQLFDVDAWLDGFVYAGTARYFHNRELEKRIQGWIEAAPLVEVPAWEDFCRRRCQGETKAAGLLAVGRRVAVIDHTRAVDMLIDAWKSCAEFFYMHGPLAGEICSEVMRLDRERGCELLFESFRQQYQRYPESLIYALNHLLDFSGALPSFDAVRLYEIWSEHNRRLAAGLSAKPVDVGWLADDASGEFYDHCLRYLLDLFEYPEVDVRRLALEQLFLLVRDRRELTESLVDLWSGLSSGQKEYVVSLLFSLGITNPASVEDWAPRLVEIAQRERHYNLRATIAEAVSAGVDYGAELDLSLVTEARALKSAPRIVQPPSLLARPRQGVRYPPYFRWALGLLEDVAPPSAIESRTRAILARLYPQPERGFEEEVAVHRHYNINTNFDVIEISGDYDRAVREAMNCALHELVQEHSIDEDALGESADVLRLYDPTDVLVRRVSRPGKITWIDTELSDEEFIRYADMDSLKKRYVLRDERWVSLYEHTELRMSDQPRAEPARASKIRVTVFGVTRGSPAPTLREIDEEAKKGALAPLRNRYRFELTRMEPTLSQLLSGLGGRLVPIIQVSRRSFRGRHTPDLAAIVPELVRALGLKRHDKDLLGYALGGQQIVRSIEWQEAFDQGRRRHEPRSSGFLLEMDRELLSRWADTKGVDLWAYLIIERTTDRYKSESKMDWQVHADVFALRIS